MQLVANPAVQALVRTLLAHDVIFPSRRTVTRSVDSLLKAKPSDWIQEAQTKLPNAISITTDLSTSKAVYPYCALTGQICTSDFWMYEDLLSFSHFLAPHTGERNKDHVTAQLQSLKPEWREKTFDQICFSATTDCGSNNNALAVSDPMLKVPCAGHRGNTVTSNLDSYESWRKVCDIMDYFHKTLRHSTQNRQELKRVMKVRIANRAEIGHRSRKDVVKQLSNMPRTRWSHTPKHFERFIELLPDIEAMDKSNMSFNGNKHEGRQVWESNKRQALIDRDIVNIIYPLIEKMQFWMVRTQGSHEPTVSLIAYAVEDMVATVYRPS